MPEHEDGSPDVESEDYEDRPQRRPRVKRYRRYKGNLAQQVVGNRWFVKGIFFAIFVYACVQLLRFAAYIKELGPVIMSDQSRFAEAFGWLQSGTPSASGLPPVTGRPEVVAGLLPVGHFTSFFAWIKGGGWDHLLPAGLVIIIAALILSLFFKRGFCGWICPLGTLWEGCAALGRKVMGRNLEAPKWLDYPLRGLRYLIAFAFFFWLATLPVQEAVAFRLNPYMFIADIKIIWGFGTLFFILLFVGAAVMSFFFGSIWCRYLCPLGGLYGPLSMASPSTICRDEELCIDCGKCTQACHAFIKVDEKTSVRSPECDGCMDCVHACPVDGAVEMKIAHRYEIPAWTWPLVIALIWFAIYLIAKITGNWNTPIPTNTFAVALNTVGQSGGFTADSLSAIIKGLFGM